MRSVPRRTRGRIRALAAAGLLGLVPLLAACTAPPPPPGPQARGIDVSNWQHPGGAPINWPMVRQSGVEFAFIKATEGPVTCGGNYYTNSWFRQDWIDSAAAGIYRGAYHFARPGDVASAINQARYFVNAVGPMNGPRDLPPVLDLEQSCGLDATALATFARAWVGEVQRLTGRTPIVYTYYYFWRDTMRSEPSLAHLPLWIATYGPKPMVPAPWNQWTFWQYTSTGAVPGIVGNVDLNWFAWDIQTLARYVVEGASNPHGHLDVAEGGAGSVRVAGWARDPDNPAPIQTHVWIGSLGVALNAEGHRPDVGAAFPGAGDAHGFDHVITGVPPGRREVCAHAINSGPGHNTLIRCATVDVGPVEPFGHVDGVIPAPGRVQVVGWAIDPDTVAPTDVHIHLDGVPHLAARADGNRPDVGQVFPRSGARHGFTVDVTGLTPGPHVVCTFAMNTAGPGDNTLLDCRTVTVPA